MLINADRCLLLWKWPQGRHDTAIEMKHWTRLKVMYRSAIMRRQITQKTKPQLSKKIHQILSPCGCYLAIRFLLTLLQTKVVCYFWLLPLLISYFLRKISSEWRSPYYYFALISRHSGTRACTKSGYGSAVIHLVLLLVLLHRLRFSF